MFRNWWIRLGCFLTGYNYKLLKHCSEASKKTVKKYTAALLIVMVLWAVIGYLFSRNYIRLDYIGAGLTAFIMVVFIVQIERQIILGSKNSFAKWFRVIIGLVMAVLGSVIIDQIVFTEDIEKHKIMSVDEEVELLLPKRTMELNSQKLELDTLIGLKEFERAHIIQDVTDNPTIKIPTQTSTKTTKKIPYTINENGIDRTLYKDTIVVDYSYTTSSIPNPKAEMISGIDTQIQALLDKRDKISKDMLDIRTNVRKELMDTKGFLDELEMMVKLLLSSPVSLIVWLLWFLFFLAIELFVLVSKYGDKENDYDKLIQHQLKVRMKSLDELLKNQVNLETS